MEQELNFTLQFILFALTGLTGIAVLIFALRKKDNTPFDWEAFERTVKLMHDQTDANLDMLTKMNKQKDKIEEKILPVLDVCNEENIRFDCRIPFEDYGSDNDINMKNLTNLYSKILNKRNVDFNDIYTNEICDGKYELKLNADLSLKICAWDDFDIVVNNVDSIEEYCNKKESEKNYE